MRAFDMEIFADRLGAARHLRRLTKRDVAHKAGMNAPHSLTYLEKAQKPGLHVTTLMRLAQALDVSTDYLLGLTDDPTPHWTRQEAHHPGA